LPDTTPVTVTAAAALLSWPYEQLWVDYLVLGGHWSYDVVTTDLNDGAPVTDPSAVAEASSSRQGDLVALALNELLAERGHRHRVPLSAHMTL